MSDISLKDLRNKLDNIDIEIQDLLNKRAELSLEVKKIKKGDKMPLRTGREAQIIRALIKRNKGHFPIPELIRIWREILSASLRAQGTFSVAIYKPESENNNLTEYIETARNHFGAYTQMHSYTSFRRIIEAVHDDECVVGVLPSPNRYENAPWWSHLASQGNTKRNGIQEKPIRIIAKLPFAIEINKVDFPECLVITKGYADRSGTDSTYLALDLNNNITNTRISDSLKEGQLKGVVHATWHDLEGPERWLVLIEVEGFIIAEDSKLDSLRNEFSDVLNELTILGHYALPINMQRLLTDKK